MKKIFSFIIFAIFIINPSIGQTKKELKAEKKQQEYLIIKELINSKQFEFTGEWATSSRGKRINLMSNPTFMKIEGATADGFFPFFGTAHSGSAYGGDGGIEFKGDVENYTVNFNDKKQEITITFKAKGKNDNYTISAKVFASGSTSINITSNNRSNMSYTGKTNALEKKGSK